MSSIRPDADTISAPPGPDALLAGTLHVYVAFDWGDEVDLERASRLVPAQARILPRRPRTPGSFAYRPPPLRFSLAAVPLDLPQLGPAQASAEATVFDFAAVSVALHVPLERPAADLLRLAGGLADSTPLIRLARGLAEPLFRQLLPAIRDPLWADELSEEYFVFQFPPGRPLTPDRLRGPLAGWLARLVRLEAGPLSDEEIAEALRLHLSYSPDDLFVPDWAAAFLLDQDCDETLQAIEFANLQLLEYRHIDNRLDDTLAAYTSLQRGRRRRLPVGFTHYRYLRALGEMKVEANGLFERTGNVLKLVGDQYLARLYRLAAARFHLREWEQNIARKLDVAEGVYQVASDQAATFRLEFLEVIVILLIALEIMLALFVHR